MDLGGMFQPMTSMPLSLFNGIQSAPLQFDRMFTDQVAPIFSPTRRQLVGQYPEDDFGFVPEDDSVGPSPSTGPGNWNHIVPGGRGTTTRDGTHGGYPAVDIFADEGTPIYAPVDGVSTPGTYSLGGNATTIRGADGRFYYFAHAQRPMFGGTVKKGQIIGYVGRTGNARNTAPHLHYAVATRADAFSRFNGSGDIDPY
jgi:murein DD-endopeptidase MepM/ murein hydrolase activator NlpD